MLRWFDVVGQQERYKELLREAQRSRLVLHELALSERRDRFHRRVISWLGRGLVTWGWRLQEWFPAMNEAPSAPRPPTTDDRHERYASSGQGRLHAPRSR